MTFIYTAHALERTNQRQAPIINSSTKRAKKKHLKMVNNYKAYIKDSSRAYFFKDDWLYACKNLGENKFLVITVMFAHASN
jgi:hypothetical protein